jgi:N-acetylglucosaminyldiphosphoundecaprenol N-acetyl-beta-D-mannosaminyltransferase
LQAPGKHWLACFNPHSYAVAQADAHFSEALGDADWLVADGVGVVIASRWLGGRVADRVTGSDIFAGLHQRMNAQGGMKVFFLGSTEETLAAIRTRMAKDFPGIEVSGTYSPPFKHAYSECELKQMIDAVNNASPDVLWVGMTAPKQEKWIFDNLPSLNVRFAGAVGAVFDFYTGRVKRSHPLFQKLGLEWLPRLLQQPREPLQTEFLEKGVGTFDTPCVKIKNRTNGTGKSDVERWQVIENPLLLFGCRHTHPEHIRAGIVHRINHLFQLTLGVGMLEWGGIGARNFNTGEILCHTCPNGSQRLLRGTQKKDLHATLGIHPLVQARKDVRTRHAIGDAATQPA